MQTHKYIALPIVAMIVLAAPSCKKFLTIDKPIGELVTSGVFNDTSSAESSVLGLYSQITSSNYSFLFGDMTVLGGLSSDEITRTTVTQSYHDFQENSIDVTNGKNNTVWRDAYNYIYHINVVIQNLQQSNQLAEEKKNQLTGELKCMRAFCYFYLVNMYGAVPLATSPDFRDNASLTRSGVEDVYQLIVQDLKDAKDVLLNATLTKTRAGYWAASALLARTYLYLGDWENAEKESSAIINSGQFSLEAIDAKFLTISREAIFQLSASAQSSVNSVDGVFFLPSGENIAPEFAIRQELLDAFEQNDLRKTAWLDTTIVNGVPYIFPYKYKIRFSPTVTERNIALRFSEQYFIRAEALTKLGATEDAVKDMDSIRVIAGLELISTTHPAINAEELLELIAKEKRIEFFAEWGHRWSDLKRTGKADEVLQPIKPLWTSTSVLFPIPQNDILANPFLTQNDGY